MKKAKQYLKGCEHDGSYIPVNEVIRIIKQVQIEAINEAVKRCADSAEISVVDEDMSRVEFTINSESILKVAEQLKKEIE